MEVHLHKNLTTFLSDFHSSIKIKLHTIIKSLSPVVILILQSFINLIFYKSILLVSLFIFISPVKADSDLPSMIKTGFFYSPNCEERGGTYIDAPSTDPNCAGSGMNWRNCKCGNTCIISRQYCCDGEVCNKHKFYGNEICRNGKCIVVKTCYHGKGCKSNETCENSICVPVPTDPFESPEEEYPLNQEYLARDYSSSTNNIIIYNNEEIIVDEFTETEYSTPPSNTLDEFTLWIQNATNSSGE